MLNDFISSCSAQATKFHKRLQSDLKNLPKVEILKFHFFNFKNVILIMSERHNFSLMLYIYPIWFVPDKKHLKD